MDINEALRAFGLSDKEIRIYLAALELGTAKANQIAEKSFSERTYTYQILRELQVKGLVSTIIKSGIKYFEVASPDNILSLLKEKEEKINLVLPQLNAMYKIYNQKPKIQVFEGRQGIKTMLNIILKDKKEIYNISSATVLLDKLKFEFPHFIKKRIKEKIPIKIIVEKTKETIKDKKNASKEYREIKFLKGKKKFTSSIFLFGDKMSIIILKNDFLGIQIENKEMVNDQKAIFEMLWDNL